MAKSKQIDFKQQVTNYEKSITNLALRKAKQEVFITFNFSFLSQNSSYNLSNPELTPEHKHLLFEKICELSKMSMIVLTAKSKKTNGLEKIEKFGRDDRINGMKIHPKFVESIRNELTNKGFWIFRLCSNNNPFPTRIIGKMIDDVFYIMFIDIEHELYARRT